MNSLRNDDLEKAFIQKLIARRKELGITQTELAKQIGVPQSTIGRYETLVISPSLSHIVRICQVLKVELDLNGKSFLGKRILIIGCAGSGKTYFSRKLSKLFNISRIHIDSIYWKEDKSHISREELLKEFDKIFQTDSFILDGNYSHTLSYRLDYADTVFFFDFPKELCLQGIKERKGKQRSDMPFISSDGDRVDLLEHINNFAKEDRPLILEELDKHPNINVIIFHDRDEANNYLKSLK